MGNFRNLIDRAFIAIKWRLGGLYDGTDPWKLHEAMIDRKNALARALYNYARQLAWLQRQDPESTQLWDRYWNMPLLKVGREWFPIFPYTPPDRSKRKQTGSP